MKPSLSAPPQMRMTPTISASAAAAVGVMVGPRPGDRRQRASENGRNGRIRADRKTPARAEQRKPDRARGKREEADPRRQPGKAGGRHLRGDGDCGQRQASEGVRLQIAGAPAGKRPQDEPGRASVSGRGGNVLARLCHSIAALKQTNGAAGFDAVHPRH